MKVAVVPTFTPVPMLAKDVPAGTLVRYASTPGKIWLMVQEDRGQEKRMVSLSTSYVYTPREWDTVTPLNHNETVTLTQERGTA